MGYSHIIDSRYHGSAYCTAESKAIFEDNARLDRWLKIEIALAQAQAKLGIIPVEAANEIMRVANLANLDLEKIAQGIQRTNHRLVPLLKEVEKKCKNDFGQYIHFGATTQDIQDTEQILAIKSVIHIIEKDLKEILVLLKDLAEKHRLTLQTGRTHAQPALPITFGLKAAAWYDEMYRSLERLHSSKERILVAELFGGCGTMSAFGEKGLDLLEAFSNLLELNAPAMSWHVARDRIVEYVFNLAILTAGLARIADEIRTLSRHEFGELSIEWQSGTIGSSTMPHKRNPEECEQVVVLARLVKAQANVILDTQIVDHERDYRGTRIEWVAVTDASHYSLKALEISKFVLSNLKVNKDVMFESTTKYKEEICTEALMFELAKMLGKQNAYQLVYKLSQEGLSSKKSLVDLLKVVYSIFITGLKVREIILIIF